MKPLVDALRSGVTRRSFLKWSAVATAGTAAGVLAADAGGLIRSSSASAAPSALPIEEKYSACCWNCGSGSCVLKMQVQDGTIVRVDTDQHDMPWAPAQRACLRGRSMRQHVYNPDRLKKPMKRVGKRGEGKFVEISWDEAFTIIADNLKRIIAKYGNHAVHYQYSSGIISTPLYTAWKGGPVLRLLNLMGGYVDFYGSYSSACFGFAMPYTYGQSSNNSVDDLVNSRLVVLWADNSAETRHGGGGNYAHYLRAKKAGAKFIVIDPRLSDTARALADEWIPIKPTTDNALIDALAYVMIRENLHDQAFLDKYCVGFDEEHLPKDAPAKSSYKSYLLGHTDGVMKTPEWAEPITGVPAETIVRLAREIALTKPTAMLQGLGWQRHAYGEQPVRALPVLMAMTGNIGKKGGGTGSSPGGKGGAASLSLPTGTNPCKAQISFYHWPEAIVNGTKLTPKDGLRGVERLESNFKFIWNYAGNAMINQHSDINGTKKILEDESMCEFILVHDLFMTPTAKFADLLLPDRTNAERQDLGRNATAAGDQLYYSHQVIKPLYDTMDAWEICRNVAKKLGIEDKFTEGKMIEQWQQQLVEAARKTNPAFPTLDELKKTPIVKSKETPPTIAFAAFIADPVKSPLRTPSGKIEIYSASLGALAKARGLEKELPAIARYVPAWEGPQDPLTAKYPLQCIGHHTKRRAHSTHDNNPWLEEVEPQRLWINEIDAMERGIKDGDTVRVYNDRGEIHVRCRVIKSIMPGVVDLPQGAWWAPNEKGIDTRGSINVITKYHPTPGAKGNPQHTNLVQVAKL